MLKDLVVLDDQNGLAKEYVESDVVALGLPDRFANEQPESLHIEVRQAGRVHRL